MKKAILIAALPAVLFLTACKDTSSPTGVVKTAGYALKTNDTATFISTLAGNAKVQFANNKQSVSALQNKLAGMDLTIAGQQLLSRGHCGNLCDSARYQVVVAGRVNSVGAYSGMMDLTVECRHYTSGDPKRGYNYTNKCWIIEARY